MSRLNIDGVEVVLIESEEPRKCELCGALEETRPYGPRGEQVCFLCMLKDEKAAKRQMRRQLLGEETQ